MYTTNYVKVELSESVLHERSDDTKNKCTKLVLLKLWKLDQNQGRKTGKLGANACVQHNLTHSLFFFFERTLLTALCVHCLCGKFSYMILFLYIIVSYMLLITYKNKKSTTLPLDFSIYKQETYKNIQILQISLIFFFFFINKYPFIKIKFFRV